MAAYHDLYQVERSFRMTKSDLAARPVFHRLRDSIEAHLTIVFAALAVSREAQARTGLSINKIVKTLRPLRTATITLGRQQITAEPRIPAAAQQILDDLRRWSLNRYNSGLSPRRTPGKRSWGGAAPDRSSATMRPSLTSTITRHASPPTEQSLRPQRE